MMSIMRRVAGARAEAKQESLDKILDAAARRIREEGLDGAAIVPVMRDAGLTHGAFYSHFSSKEDLYAEAVRSYSTCNPFAREAGKVASRPGPKQAARRLVELYLSDAVLNDIDQHCPLFALPSDVARAGLEPRAAYTFLVREMLEIFRAAFDQSDPRAAAKAQVILNLCVGGMVIARTTDDSALRRSLRAAALEQALRLLES